MLLSYEYYKRDALKFGERDFASTFDQRARGGADRRLIHANPGNILSPMTFEPAYALPKNQDGRNLNVSDLLPNQVNKSDRLGDVDLLPRQSRHGLFIVVQQEITHNIEVFAEGRYSNRKFKQTGDPLTSTLVVPSQNPFFIDPFNVGFTLVNYSFETEL